MKKVKFYLACIAIFAISYSFAQNNHGVSSIFNYVNTKYAIDIDSSLLYLGALRTTDPILGEHPDHVILYAKTDSSLYMLYDKAGQTPKRILTDSELRSFKILSNSHNSHINNILFSPSTRLSCVKTLFSIPILISLPSAYSIILIKEFLKILYDFS